MEHHSSGDQQQHLGFTHLDHFRQESDLAGTPFEQHECWNKCTPNLKAEDRTAVPKSETNYGPRQCHEKQQSKLTDVSLLGLAKRFQNVYVPVKLASNHKVTVLNQALNEELPKRKEEHGKEVTKLEPPKIYASVQLFHSHYGNTIKAIEVDFKSLLKNKLENVDFVICNQLEEIDPAKMLIVLCIITSRVGTDAAYAIKGIKTLNPANTILVLIHVKDSHALPKQASSSVLTDQTFRNLGDIFDLAFVNGRGIYQCEMNDITLDGVCDFVNKNK